MKKTIWTRVLALCLAAVCLIGAVGAANLVYDRNGDGKTNVWDLQLLAKDADADKVGALIEALGGKDELHPVEKDVYEIYTTLGLLNMAKIVDKNEGRDITFRLMNDLDLNGMDWNGDLIFSGTLEGNGHVISNFYVDDDTGINTSGGRAQGFFAKIGRYGAVRNLKLENVTVKIPADSKVGYVGLLTGSLTGEITNCTTVGNVIDERTGLTNICTKGTDGAICYIGTLAGRIENTSSYTPVGVQVTDESVLMTAESAAVTAISGKSQKVLCKMGMEFTELAATNDGLTYKRQLGIIGWAPNYDKTKNYNWQDISGACTVEGGTGKTYNLIDPILTQRRQETVDKMREICTVEWTPSQNMTMVYYKVGTGGNAGKLAFNRVKWTAGTTYYGMPYNHGSGSLERFYAYMDEDANGKLTVKSDVPKYGFYYTYSGVLNAMNTDGATASFKDVNYSFGRTTTSDLLNEKWLLSAEGSLLTGYSNGVYDLSHGYNAEVLGDSVIYDKVTNADHAGFCRYIGNDCSQAIMWAWREVVSSDVKSGGTVISGVRQMCPTPTNQSRYGVTPVANMIPSAYSVEAIDEMYNAKGQTGFFEAYAQASRGDALICDQTAGGHSRMIAYDPICIRNYRGTIHSTNSYLITHEQGGQSKEGYNTTCHWDRVMTFAELTDHDDHVNDNTGGKGANCSHYFPSSINAFHNVDNAAVTSNVTYADGVVKSNFYILSTTVDGVETFNAIGQHNTTNTTTLVGSGYREAHVQTNLTERYGDLAGKTVTVRLSNGEQYTVNGDTGAVAKVAN